MVERGRVNVGQTAVLLVPLLVDVEDVFVRQDGQHLEPGSIPLGQHLPLRHRGGASFVVVLFLFPPRVFVAVDRAVIHTLSVVPFLLVVAALVGAKAVNLVDALDLARLSFRICNIHHRFFRLEPMGMVAISRFGNKYLKTEASHSQALPPK